MLALSFDLKFERFILFEKYSSEHSRLENKREHYFGDCHLTTKFLQRFRFHLNLCKLEREELATTLYSYNLHLLEWASEHSY